MSAPSTSPSQPCVSLPQDLSLVLISALPDSSYYITSFITEAEEEYLLHKIQSQPQSTWHTLSHRRLQCHPSALSPSGSLIKALLPHWLEEPLISRLLSLQLPYPASASSSSTADEIDHDVVDNYELMGLFESSLHSRPNHVLINEYPPGTGIAAHEDGAAYWPLVATISLGGSCVLDLYPKVKNSTTAAMAAAGDGDGDAGGSSGDSANGIGCDRLGTRGEPKYRVLQERRSLLITMGGLYRDYLHGIQDVRVDQGLNEESIVNWSLLREKTRLRIEEDGGSMERGLRISVTIRDVIKVKDLGRLLPGIVGGGKR